MVPAAAAPRAAHRLARPAPRRAPAGRHRPGHGPAQSSPPAARTTPRRCPPTCSPGRLLRLRPGRGGPAGRGRLRDAPARRVSAPLYLAPRPLEIASDAEDERPPGVPPQPRPPRRRPQLPIRVSWRLIDALGDVSYGPVWTLAPEHPLTASGDDGTGAPRDHRRRSADALDKIGLTALPSVGAPRACGRAGPARPVARRAAARG